MTVPANLPGLHWRPVNAFDGGSSDPNMVTLATTTNPGVALGFTATQLASGGYLIVPDQPLVAGTSYTLTDGNTCADSPGPSATFHAGPAVPLPAQLGALTAVAGDVGPLQVATASGSCSAEIQADQATIDLELAADAVAWRDALHYETWVDGALWRPQVSINVFQDPSGSWRGRGADRIYQMCSSTDPTVGGGLAAGLHDVTMRATLPGSTTVLMSSTVTVELDCVDDPPTCATDPTLCDDPNGGTGGGGGCSTGGGNMAPWLLLAFAALLRKSRR